MSLEYKSRDNRVPRFWSAILPKLDCATLAGHSATASANLRWNGARNVTDETIVPLHIFLEITRSFLDGKKTIRWPWSSTPPGDAPSHLATREAAFAFFCARFLRGTRHFPVGCFDVACRDEARAFSFVEAPFWPTANAIHAEKTLRELRRQTHTREAAVSSYRCRKLHLAREGGTHSSSTLVMPS